MGSEKILPSMDALRSAVRAAARKKKIAFLVGSPLSMQEPPDAPQVPGVTAMLQLIRKRVPSEHLQQFDAELKTDKDNAYQWAMKFIQDRDSRAVANEVIREAVLRARFNPGADSGLDDAQLDADFGGWALPPATLHLGKLLAEHPGRFGPVLTTNFDPLLSASVKMAGGEFLRTVVDRDEPFSQAKLSASNFAHLVYLHGYWLEAETLHTPLEIARERSRVSADIVQVLTSHTLVVVGYGGWEDVFTQTLAAINQDRHKQVDILWAFFDRETSIAYVKNKHFLDRVKELTGRNQLRLYGEINCHSLFAKLREDFGTKDTPDKPRAIKEPHHGRAEPHRPSQSDGAPPDGPVPESPPSPPSAPTVTVSPVINVAPVIQVQAAPVKPSRSASGRFAAVIAGGLIAGGVAVVSQRPDSGKESPPLTTVRPIEQPPSAFVPMAPGAQIRTVRQQHQVVPASESERGARVAQLPKGRYAFLRMDSIPAYNANTPTYGDVSDGIEVHRARASGELFLVGFADPQSIMVLASPSPAPIVLAATPGGRRTQAASVPVKRMSTAEVRMDKGSRVLVLQLN